MLYDAEQVKLMFDEHAILFYDQEGVTFYDAIRLFGNSAFEKSLNTVKAVIDKIKAETPKPFTIHGAKPAEAGRSPQMGGDSQLRKAMGLS